jgi:hypothetical protein
MGPRVLSLEKSLAYVRISLEELTRSSTQSASSDAVRSSATNRLVSTTMSSRSATPQANTPLVADRNSRTAPASMIRDMTHCLLPVGDEGDSHESDFYEDIVAKGIINEEMTHSLLVG